MEFRSPVALMVWYSWAVAWPGFAFPVNVYNPSSRKYQKPLTLYRQRCLWTSFACYSFKQGGHHICTLGKTPLPEARQTGFHSESQTKIREDTFAWHKYPLSDPKVGKKWSLLHYNNSFGRGFSGLIWVAVATASGRCRAPSSKHSDSQYVFKLSFCWNSLMSQIWSFNLI